MILFAFIKQLISKFRHRDDFWDSFYEEEDVEGIKIVRGEIDKLRERTNLLEIAVKNLYKAQFRNNHLHEEEEKRA
jgi:LPS sulfotransferase NodH